MWYSTNQEFVSVQKHYGIKLTKILCQYKEFVKHMVSNNQDFVSVQRQCYIQLTRRLCQYGDNVVSN